MAEPNFHVKLTLRIDWSELDTFGHVNNISIFKYIQSARVEYLEQIGLNVMHQEHKIGPILASCKCEFRKTIILSRTNNHTIKSRFYQKYKFLYLSPDNGRERQYNSGSARTSLYCLTLTKIKKTQLPQELRKVIEKP